MEGSAHCEAKKGAALVYEAHRGAPATQGVMAPIGETVRERERKKTLDDGDTSGSPGMLAGNRLGRAGLKEG
jgi:hypothetical protein